MKNTSKTICGFLIAISAMINTHPFYIWHHEGIYLVGSGVLLTTAVAYAGQIKPLTMIESMVIFISTVCVILLSNGSIFGALFFGVFMAISCFIPNDILRRSFDWLKLIFAVLVLPGLLLWLIHNLINNNLFYIGSMPADIIPNQLKAEANQGYAIYPFTVVLDYMLHLPVYRMQGPFDEPGWLGTICILMMAAGGINLKKPQDIIILTAGLLSLSLAFYILLFVYLLFSIKKARLEVLAFIFLFFLLGFIFFDAIDAYILNRLNLVDGGISGYNRDGAGGDYKFNLFMNSEPTTMLFGVSDYIPDGSSSYKDTLRKIGFAGLFLIMLSYAAVFIRRSSNVLSMKIAPFVLIFILSALQRPDIMKPFMFLLFIIALSIAAKNNQQIEG